MTMAPVKVDSSSIVVNLYFYWTQFMQSASTSLPSASVLPIQTVSPFLDSMISRGRQLLQLMKFQTRPKTATTLDLKLRVATPSMALSTEQAPCLSLCMPEMPVVGLRFSPPASKVTPLPTSPTNSSLSGFPFHSRHTKTGSLLLALPTACISLNPSLSRSSPSMVVSLSPGCLAAILRASASMKEVVASLARELAHSAAWILLLLSWKIYQLSGASRWTVTSFSGFCFLENLQPLTRTSEAMPKKLFFLVISSEKRTDVSFDISLIFFQLLSSQNFSTFSFFSSAFSSVEVMLTVFDSLNSLTLCLGISCSASLEWMMLIWLALGSATGEKAGMRLRRHFGLKRREERSVLGDCRRRIDHKQTKDKN